MEKVEKTLKKAKEKVTEVAKKINEEPENVKEVKPLVTCRVLFISILDKIILILLSITFFFMTYVNFKGHIFSISYHFWPRFGREILIVIGFIIAYFFYNWLYKCAAKTMLCVTEKEVYKVIYVPFLKRETSIPLNKITAVSAHKFFWIFRGVVVHQYMSVPKVFLTWNAKEFKDKVNELIVNEKGNIKNDAEQKNLLPNEKLKYVGYVGIGLLIIIVIISILCLFGRLFGIESRIAGTYKHNSSVINLYKNGKCELPSDVSNCTWEYDSDLNSIYVHYKYYSSYYSDSYRSTYLDYDKDNKIVKYQGYNYTKE